VTKLPTIHIPIRADGSIEVDEEGNGYFCLTPTQVYPDATIAYHPDLYFDYSLPHAPPQYRCCKCNAHGCKLWRYSATSCIELHCCLCIGKEKHIDVSSINDNGMVRVNDRTIGIYRTDQIGGYVPAVPDEDGESFWGYTSVPDAGVNWWRRLPSRPVET
jgi:hypothetical protein